MLQSPHIKCHPNCGGPVSTCSLAAVLDAVKCMSGCACLTAQDFQRLMLHFKNACAVFVSHEKQRHTVHNVAHPEV